MADYAFVGLFALVAAGIMLYALTMARRKSSMHPGSGGGGGGLELMVSAPPPLPVRLWANPPDSGEIICDLPGDWYVGKTPLEQRAYIATLNEMAARQPYWH